MSNVLFKDLEGIISAPVTEHIQNIVDKLCEEYQKNSTLSLDSLSKLLGKPPIIPQSPDTDAMLDAYTARADYGSKCIAIEKFVEEYLKSK